MNSCTTCKRQTCCQSVDVVTHPLRVHMSACNACIRHTRLKSVHHVYMAACNTCTRHTSEDESDEKGVWNVTESLCKLSYVLSCICIQRIQRNKFVFANSQVSMQTNKYNIHPTIHPYLMHTQTHTHTHTHIGITTVL